MRAFVDIAIRELKRLDDKSMIEELSLEDVRKLNLLTSSIKQYMGNPLDDSEEAQIANMSLDELLAIANQGQDE